MLAIGLDDYQVGFIATVFMISQVVFAFLSGPITDKFGRRTITAIFDFVAWCIPCLIWWQARNFWFFFVAAIINGTMQVVSNSWNCLLVEDAEKNQITGINSLIVIGVQISAFFGPIVAILFSRLTLVPAMHILYINGFLLMSFKIWLTYYLSRETGMGIIRLAETRKKNIFSLALGYGGVLRIIGKSRGTIFAMAITAMVGIVVMINDTFWQVIVSKKLLVPVHLLPIFPILRSLIAILFLFFVVPYMTRGLLKIPLLAGFTCYFIGQALLILAPVDGPVKYFMLCVSLIFDGFGFGSLRMLARSLIGLHVDVAERARVMAIVQMIVMSVTSPFGWIGGMLSSISRNLPFVLNLTILALGAAVTVIYYRREDPGA
jgi:MFS family permease